MCWVSSLGCFLGVFKLPTQLSWSASALSFYYCPVSLSCSPMILLYLEKRASRMRQSHHIRCRDLNDDFHWTNICHNFMIEGALKDEEECEGKGNASPWVWNMRFGLEDFYSRIFGHKVAIQIFGDLLLPARHSTSPSFPIKAIFLPMLWLLCQKWQRNMKLHNSVLSWLLNQD